MRMRRDHAFTQRRMSDYIDGELDLERAGRLARHASECPECGPMLRSLRRLVDELHGLGAAAPRDSVVPGVMARLHAEDEVS